MRCIKEKKANISGGVAKILETISAYDNIPRKKAKFLNFMKNSFRYMKLNELEEAWTLLEEAMKENKAENAAEKNGDAKEPHGNGNLEQANGKRKLLIEESLVEEETNDRAEEPPKNKKKKSELNGIEQEPENRTVEDSAMEKFSWGETIRGILSAKNNEVKLRKLKAKVVKKYQNLTGAEWSDKVENKFNKKIVKLKGIVVDNDKVRLIQ